MANASTVNAHGDAASAAILVEDWATAETRLLAAQSELAVLPEGRLGPTELRWDRAAIDKALANVRRRRSAAAGIQRARVKHVAPTG